MVRSVVRIEWYSPVNSFIVPRTRTGASRSAASRLTPAGLHGIRWDLCVCVHSVALLLSNNLPQQFNTCAGNSWVVRENTLPHSVKTRTGYTEVIRPMPRKFSTPHEIRTPLGFISTPRLVQHNQVRKSILSQLSCRLSKCCNVGFVSTLVCSRSV